jgi:hypothetical protein
VFAWKSLLISPNGDEDEARMPTMKSNHTRRRRSQLLMATEVLGFTHDKLSSRSTPSSLGLLLCARLCLRELPFGFDCKHYVGLLSDATNLHSEGFTS